MPKLTIVIPTYTITQELEDVAIRCLMTYQDHCDELIVCEDGGFFSPGIMSLCDTYIYNKENTGFTANANRAWKQSHGDFTAIVNSDTQYAAGNLYDLCIPGKVTSPIISSQNWDGLAGAFFVVPREVMKERGKLIEDMRNYSSDSEYEDRVSDIFELVPSVQIYHQVAQTTGAAGIDNDENYTTDGLIYTSLKESDRLAQRRLEVANEA